MILNRMNHITEHTIIKDLAGFRAGKSCRSQQLNLTQYIEDGNKNSLTTGTVFVELSAAYDTVNHRVLLTKLYGMTENADFTKLIKSMMRNRQFYVELNGKKADGTIRRMVYLKEVFSRPCYVYTNDQHIHNETCSFIYADDLCIARQRSTFE